MNPRDLIDSVISQASGEHMRFKIWHLMALTVFVAIVVRIVDVNSRRDMTVDELLEVVASPRPIPYAKRQAAKEALIARPYSEVLPKVALRITAAPDDWSARIRISGTGRGLGDEKSPAGEQAIWALEQIWQAHVTGPNQKEIGRFLVDCLEEDDLRDFRGRMMCSVSGCGWCAEAEEAFARILADTTEAPEIRYRAAGALANQARDKYIDEILEFVRTNPAEEETMLVRRLLSDRRPQFTGKPVDCRLLIVANELMERNVCKSGRVASGFFMARDMGEFIASRDAGPDAWRLPNPFVANKDDPGMRGPYGVETDAFLETPVYRVRAWWSEHGESIVAGASEPPAGE